MQYTIGFTSLLQPVTFPVTLPATVCIDKMEF
jgi:hypothetical protein